MSTPPARDQLATIIYTSGTTGRPKGVRLLHDTWTYQGAATQAIEILNEDDLQYLWLPLAHSFGKVLLTLPLQIGFPTAIDGRIDKIVDNLAVVRPTFMGAAPRIFEKAFGGVQMMMAAEGGVKERLFHWAEGVGREVSDLRAEGRNPRGCWPASTRWPTGSSWPRSGSASAGGSGSSSPARRRSTSTSPAGSTRWACRSPRGTG